MNVFTFSANFALGYTFAFIRFDIEDILKTIGGDNLLKVADIALKNPFLALLILAFLVFLVGIFTNNSKEKS
jgi:hypothetical protein